MTVVSARGVVSKNSTTVIELNQAIREITEAARAVRVFANTLERNPEAVLREGTVKERLGGEEPPPLPKTFDWWGIGSSNRGGTGLKAESCFRA